MPKKKKRLVIERKSWRTKSDVTYDVTKLGGNETI